MPEDVTRPTLLPLFELAGRLALLSAAFLYALGFLVENVHLARYGYFALTLFERRYALAGFWVLCPLFLYFLFDRIVSYGKPVDNPSQKTRWLRKVLWIVGGSALIYAVENALPQVLGAPVQWLWWFPFIYGSALLYHLMTVKAVAEWRELTRTTALDASPSPVTKQSLWTTARSVLAKVEWVWSPLWVWYVVLFTYVLFPKIPARWGGGGPETVQLLVSAEAASLLPHGSDGTHPQLSAPVTLLATTAEDYVVLLDSTRVVYLRRDLVRAVALSGRFGKPTPIRTTSKVTDSAP